LEVARSERAADGNVGLGELDQLPQAKSPDGRGLVRLSIELHGIITARHIHITHNKSQKPRKLLYIEILTTAWSDETVDAPAIKGSGDAFL